MKTLLQHVDLNLPLERLEKWRGMDHVQRTLFQLPIGLKCLFDDNLAIRFPFFLNPLAETIMHFTHECISFFLPGA